MKVINIHSREHPVSSKEVGLLMDSLSSKNDLLWPHHLWPRMKFDKPLSVNATGGHGPIRYYVEKYEPGKLVKFHLTRPNGFDGYHGYEVIEKENGKTELRETIKMKTHGLAVLTWPLIFRPLHDALIEDSLTCAEVQLGLEPKISDWSAWVKLLRWVITHGNARSQKLPNKAIQPGKPPSSAAS
jgi:hypothetical protein